MPKPPSIFQNLAFFTTAAAEHELPSHAGIEIAFAGRSNAGKSSAINALANRSRLAFVSKTPGRTQHLNLFSLGADRYLVDLPGYGYAKVPRDMKRYWETLVAGYLQNRAQLRGLVVVMDARHPLMPLDIQLIEWFALRGRPLHALLTKADKLNRQQADLQRRKVVEALSDIPDATAQLFSVPDRTGIEEAESVLASWLEPPAGNAAG